MRPLSCPLSCSCEGKLATVWVGRRHARHVGGRRGEEAEGGRVRKLGARTPIGQNSSHFFGSSHLPPADGVESGAGGVGHRCGGGTEQGSGVGEKAGRTLSSWADICPTAKAGGPRKMPAAANAGKNTELTLVEILLINRQKYNGLTGKHRVVMPAEIRLINWQKYK